MENSQKSGSDKVFDATPYLKLFIDKDGRWFQNGAEITHPLIYKQFNLMLEKTADNGYLVRLGREICRVEVEDAPFVVHRVAEDADSGLSIELNDGTTEPFAADRFWIGDENVPYTEVKDGAFHARFSRPAYYQIANHIVWDEADQQYYLQLGERRVPVRTRKGVDGP